MNTNQKSMRYDQNDYDALLHSKIPAALVETPQMNFDDDSDASVFFARELDYVKSQSYDVEYPEFTALKLFPVSSEINPGAETVTYYSYDKTGMAKIISNYATDLPRADVKGKPTTAIIKSLGDSYLRGVLSKDNDVPLYVPATGAKGSTKWADKTEDEILADITGMLKQVARTTKKVEKPDTLALPSEAYIEIQNRRIESTATTVLKYIQDNITDIARIVSCPELDPDSVDTNPYAAESDGKGVALLFKNDPRKFTIENPLSFMQYPVQPEGLEMVVPCEARTAGAIIYYPMSMLIATGIC